MSKNKALALWCAALLFLLAAFASSWASHTTPQQLSRPLLQLPAEIGPWHMVGDNGDLDQGTMDLLKPSSYLIRTYVGPQRKSAALFVAFFELQKEGQMIHSPKHCLPGSGWNIANRSIVTIEGPDGPCQVNHLELARDLDRLSVLYWYQGRGRVGADEYRERALLVWDGLLAGRSDGALVRITSPMLPDGEQTLRLQKEFASRLIPELNKFLPPAENNLP